MGKPRPPNTHLLLRDLRRFDGEVAEQVDKLRPLAPVGRQFRPHAPHQVEQRLLLAAVGTPAVETKFNDDAKIAVKLQFLDENISD